jgi:hypothetical protein
MPKTPPTIVAPLPNDPRVMSLVRAVGLTKREAFAAAAEAWAWMSVMAVDGIVTKAAPDSLDAVVDVAGFGQAMLQAGLVGAVDDGLVLPAELRHRDRDERGGRPADEDGDEGDRAQRKRAGDRRRQRRHRAKDKLTKPASAAPAIPQQPAAATPKPRRLGDAGGYSVMLLYSRTGVPFYKLAGASPREWTATVNDPDNPSLADAFVSLLLTMKREQGKGSWDGRCFQPTMEEVTEAAKWERDRRESTAVAAARREDGNRAFAEAAADALEDADQSVTERDCHAPVTPVTRDTVTVTLLSRSESVTCPPNSSDERDFGSVTCHAPVTPPAPSSSSSLRGSSFSEENPLPTTTTTSSVTLGERDNIDRPQRHAPDMLDRVMDGMQTDPAAVRSTDDPQTAERKRKKAMLTERFADALGASYDGIIAQWRDNSDILFARLKAAGIDPATGLPVNAGGSHEPAAAREDIDATAEPMDEDEPAEGVLGAPGESDIGAASDSVIVGVGA